MSDGPRPHALRWAPPFLVGVAAATAAEVALALLVYSGPGLVRSLTTVLVVEAAALALGLWMGPGGESEAVESLRRRWLLSMVAFLAATLFSASWSLVQELGGGSLGQGLGLAAMGALPLYGCGSVLSGMAAVDREGAGATGDPLGGPAALGAALGFLGTGLALPRLLTPASLFLAGLILLSLAGLVYGAALDRKLRVRVRARRPSASGEVRVEDRQSRATGKEVRVLLEASRVRLWSPVDGDGQDVPWERAVYRAVLGGPGRDGASGLAPDDAPPPPSGEAGPRVLVVGGGASSLPRAAVRGHPSVRVDVVERSQAVVELAREHLNTGLAPEPGDRIRVRVGNVDDLLAQVEDAYDLVLVETRAFGAVGGLSALSRAGRTALAGCVGTGGVLALGPAAPDSGSWAMPAGWTGLRIRRNAPVGTDVIGDRAGIREEVLLYGRGELPAGLASVGEVVREGEPEEAAAAGEPAGGPSTAPRDPSP